MAKYVSLMTYLQHGFNPMPIIDQGQSTQNTRSSCYGATDIESIGHWAEFNLPSIQHQFGRVLAAARIRDKPMCPSAARPVNSEDALQREIEYQLTDRARRGIREGFLYMHSTNLLAGLTILKYDTGSMAMSPDLFTPDVAVYDINLPMHTRPNRVPGCIKPSYKWSLAHQHSPDPAARTEFKQALSEVNFYMKQHRTRYGFIVSDRELVAIRRRDRNGNLDLSPAIPWTANGTEKEPQMTVLLGLWYLCMLAADDRNWSLE